MYCYLLFIPTNKKMAKVYFSHFKFLQIMSKKSTIQTEKVKAATIIREAREINEQRIANKKKPLKVLENIVEGIFKTYGKVGLDQYKLNLDYSS